MIPDLGTTVAVRAALRRCSDLYSSRAWQERGQKRADDYENRDTLSLDVAFGFCCGRGNEMDRFGDNSQLHYRTGQDIPD